jgi:glutamine synthetase
MADRPKTVADVLRMMKDKDVKFLDLRFTDTKGKMQHVTADGSCVDEACSPTATPSTAPRSPAGRASRPPT